MRKLEEGLLTRLLDSLSDIFVLVLDQHSCIIYANSPFLHHFGLTWQEVIGRPCRDLVCPFVNAHEEKARCCPVGPASGSPPHTLFSRTAQGKRFFYEANSYHLLDGHELPFTLCIFRDVTEKYRLESQLRHLHELERTLVKTSMDGIILNDMEGNILIFNEGASRILGYQPEEVVGKLNVEGLYPPNLARDVKLKLYDQAYGDVGLLENYETLVRSKDGAEIPIWLSARLLRDDGREIGIVGYFRDLRERKRWEEELLRNERLATLGKMVAHITHEIKNPLLVIGGFAHQLQRLDGLPPEAPKKVQFIIEEVQRLEEFLVSLGTFTRLPSCRKTPGNLVALAREAASMLAGPMQDQGVAFQMAAPDDAPPVPFDPGQLRQVLLNLYKNSLEAMPRGGRLSVSVQVRSDSVRLTIRDTGQGILPEHLPSLFTPFFSTKEKGTGLGLAICRQFIHSHQGEISIDSQPGQGTAVLITLPRS
ncbi:MAG: PAS domain S-box protein [Deltaproteobacteria bacterium]|nr:PAS domain S-box protein [Deltaproteobacteria bacterium]